MIQFLHVIEFKSSSCIYHQLLYLCLLFHVVSQFTNLFHFMGYSIGFVCLCSKFSTISLYAVNFYWVNNSNTVCSLFYCMNLFIFHTFFWIFIYFTFFIIIVLFYFLIDSPYSSSIIWRVLNNKYEYNKTQFH